MQPLSLSLGLAIAMAAAPLLAADSGPDDVRATTLAAIDELDERGQKIAQRYLKDRVAGDPVQCIPRTRLRRSTAASDDVLLYDDGSTVYVNAPYLGCPRARDHTLINSTPIGRLCSGDILLVQDLVARVPLGSCALGEFVPFKRVKR
ncbi:hypothetical protein [Blastomonas sp.]|uniref:hypothetical protein n=1 Tax=Blastomonas sp. TaxID=1909299 RepID=UPI003593534E